MRQSTFHSIITKRLLLRRLQDSDWKMISYLRTDKDINKYVKRQSAESKQKAIEFIQKIGNDVMAGKSYYWTITKKGVEQMIGSICLWNFSEDQKTAEVGYDLSPEYQQQGIMNESLKSILDFGFLTLHLESIEAYTHHANESSKKLLLRNGFIVLDTKVDSHNQDNIIYELKNIK